MGGGKARSGAEDAAGSAVYDQIMLKFRPIAPKPLGDGEVADPNKEVLVKKRPKRKYVRVNKNKLVCDNKDDTADKSVVTLQLLPVTDKISPTSSYRDLNIPDLNVSGAGEGRRVVESWVTLECVTDGYDNEGWLGWTDGEKMMNLERDTCPGFLFDGFDREVVKWVNLSYKLMVSEEEEAEAVVRVVVKGRFPMERAAFSCRARVAWYRRKQQQGNGVSEEKQTVTVPCDVWRMEHGDGGLFACRLDVKAALSLGR